MLSTSYLTSDNDPRTLNKLGSPFAQKLFEESRSRATLGWIKQLLGLGKPLALLSDYLQTGVPRQQHSAGTRTVDLRDIVGSESRIQDFDRDFNPRSDHIRVRWIKIMDCFLNGTGLPAIQLIQVGDDYYVRDGHHRVSAARALGMVFIEAEVVVLEPAA